MTTSSFARPAGFLAAGLAAVLALLLAAAGPLAAQDKDPLVATVNGVEIHQSDLAIAEEEAGQIPPMSPRMKATKRRERLTRVLLFVVFLGCVGVTAAAWVMRGGVH